MCEETTLRDSSGATSSPGSADGIAHYDSPSGRQVFPFGQVPRPASRSVAPAKGRAKKIPATCGPSFDASSPSAVLQASLESRLRQRLDVNGSLEYSLTWKHWDMPARVPICALRASRRRISGNACTGWPSPNLCERGAELKESKDKRGSGGVDLQTAATLAGWRSPAVQNSQGGPLSPEKTNARSRLTLQSQAVLAGYPTPQSYSFQESHAPGQVKLDLCAKLAGFATPRAEERSQRNSRDNYEALSKQVSGAITTSSRSATGNRGVLNPALPRWLLGYPEAWCLAAIRASRTLTKARRRG